MSLVAFPPPTDPLNRSVPGDQAESFAIYNTLLLFSISLSILVSIISRCVSAAPPSCLRKYQITLSRCAFRPLSCASSSSPSGLLAT